MPGMAGFGFGRCQPNVLLFAEQTGTCRNIQGRILRPCRQRPSATATYVSYRTYRQSKPADTANIRETVAMSPSEPVLLAIPAIFAA
jgi:hypothetical protein